jgi:hypothetical protein
MEQKFVKLEQNNQTIFLLVDFSNVLFESSIGIKVTDGCLIWEGSFGITDKPSSRCKENDADYLNILCNCLQSINYAKYDYQIVITDVAHLTIKV